MTDDPRTRSCPAGCGRPLTLYQVDIAGQHWHPDCIPPGTPPSMLPEVFVRRVLDVFAKADIREELLWRVEGRDVRFAVDVSDVFAWGCADAEDITPPRLATLEQAYTDLDAVGGTRHTAELYAARIRGMRPQGAPYPTEAAAQALFDACGPERPIGPGNPKRLPQPSLETK